MILILATPRPAGTDIEVPINPAFRLFATQNGARYANRHALPLSIKGRFLEVQVSRDPVPDCMYRGKSMADYRRCCQRARFFSELLLLWNN
jgi:MoxR-like ATPase